MAAEAAEPTEIPSIPIVDYMRSPGDPLAREKLPRRPLLCNISRDGTKLIAVDCLGDKAVHRIPLPDQLRGYVLLSSIGHCLLLGKEYMGPPSDIRLFNPFSSNQPPDSLLPFDRYGIDRVVIDAKLGIALALVLEHDYCLAYTRLGGSDWIDLTHLVLDDRIYFETAILYEDLFYLVDRRGTKVFSLDLSLTSPELVDVTFDLPDNYEDDDFQVHDYCRYQSASLVTSGSSLFLVRWRTKLGDLGTEPIREIDVFTLDDRSKKWVPLNSIGDLSFFIGDNMPFSVSAADFPGLKGDRVYHPDPHTRISGDQHTCNYYGEDRDDHRLHLVHDLEAGRCGVSYEDKSTSHDDYLPLFSTWMLPPPV